MPKVKIINPNQEYQDMFTRRGWTLVDRIEEADLVQFTGGEDVTPDFYLRQAHPMTMSNLARDQRERKDFIDALAMNKVLAGICRGGQFLNVMCGGRMWQHVNGHGLRGTHPMTLLNGDKIDVTSTHHQMMIPAQDGLVLGTAEECTHRETISIDGEFVDMNPQDHAIPDIEVVYYDYYGVLCFQPHPEFEGYDDLADFYMKLINDYLGV